MNNLTYPQAKTILCKHVTEPHLLNHSLAVSAAMGELANHFQQDQDYWQAIGYIHDVDFEKYPTEHCHHVAELLLPEGVTETDIRAIVSHGWEICSDEQPQTSLEKSLYAVDQLTGIVMATALMRPTGISDLTAKSVYKKFKDKRFAAKCDRGIIHKGCERLDMELNLLINLTIIGMRSVMDDLGLSPKE